MTISALDWGIIAVYLTAMVAFGLWLSRKTSSGEDYFLGGRSIPPLIAAMSIMATQTSTISLIGAPAFVALKEGGGLRWLQYEIALPLAMLLIMVIFVPMLWRSGVVTIYEFLEERFGVGTRLILSAVFLVSRSIATGVTVFASAVVLQVVTGAPLWVLISIIGGVCLVYSTMGGLVADVYTDAVQLVVLWGCVVLSIVLVLMELPDLSAIFNMAPDRTVALDFATHGLGDGGTFGFWPLLFGGVFLYMSYYGTDQTQVQRVLAAPSVEDARKSLFFNGLMRFPLVLSYVLFGVALAALVAHDPSLREAVPDKHLDYLVPIFIVRYLPTGVIGIVIAGMIAATMSSLDSTFNSLSASTMRDYVERFGLVSAKDQRKYLLTARGVTFFWGILCCSFAFLVGGISDTVIESINKIGSVFYGPVLAVFLLAFLTRWVTALGAVAGLVAGVGLNIYLWIAQDSISWLWWNVFGLVVAVAIAVLLSLPSLGKARAEAEDTARKTDPTTTSDWVRYGVLLAVTVLIIAVSWGLSWFLSTGG